MQAESDELAEKMRVTPFLHKIDFDEFQKHLEGLTNAQLDELDSFLDFRYSQLDDIDYAMEEKPFFVSLLEWCNHQIAQHPNKFITNNTLNRIIKNIKRKLPELFL